MKTINFITGLLLSVLLLMASSASHAQQSDFEINYEKFTFDNGLEVVFHQDDSDPVTAVALTFHVGSAREKKGKTGFAHLFEHLLFLNSENLGPGGLDQLARPRPLVDLIVMNRENWRTGEEREAALIDRAFRSLGAGGSEGPSFI